MAKKARKKLEEEAEASFEFPEFDVGAFMRHEFEQSVATGIALALAVILGVVSVVLTHVLSTAAPGVLEGIVPAGLAIATIAASPLIVGRLRAAAKDYTKGDWASMILMELFGWIGIWFLLTDVLLR